MEIQYHTEDTILRKIQGLREQLWGNLKYGYAAIKGSLGNLLTAKTVEIQICPCSECPGQNWFVVLRLQTPAKSFVHNFPLLIFALVNSHLARLFCQFSFQPASFTAGEMGTAWANSMFWFQIWDALFLKWQRTCLLCYLLKGLDVQYDQTYTDNASTWHNTCTCCDITHHARKVFRRSRYHVSSFPPSVCTSYFTLMITAG